MGFRRILTNDSDGLMVRIESNHNNHMINVTTGPSPQLAKHQTAPNTKPILTFEPNTLTQHYRRLCTDTPGNACLFNAPFK